MKNKILDKGHVAKVQGETTLDDQIEQIGKVLLQTNELSSIDDFSNFFRYCEESLLHTLGISRNALGIDITDAKKDTGKYVGEIRFHEFFRKLLFAVQRQIQPSGNKGLEFLLKQLDFSDGVSSIRAQKGLYHLFGLLAGCEVIDRSGHYAETKSTILKDTISLFKPEIWKELVGVVIELDKKTIDATDVIKVTNRDKMENIDFNPETFFKMIERAIYDLGWNKNSPNKHISIENVKYMFQVIAAVNNFEYIDRLSSIELLRDEILNLYLPYQRDIGISISKSLKRIDISGCKNPGFSKGKIGQKTFAQFLYHIYLGNYKKIGIDVVGTGKSITVSQAKKILTFLFEGSEYKIIDYDPKPIVEIMTLAQGRELLIDYISENAQKLGIIYDKANKNIDISSFCFNDESMVGGVKIQTFIKKIGRLAGSEHGIKFDLQEKAVENKQKAKKILHILFQDSEYQIIDQGLFGKNTIIDGLKMCIKNPKQYVSILQTLGRSTLIDVFLTQNSQFRSVPFDVLQTAISNYLGPFSQTIEGLGGIQGLNNLDDDLVKILVTQHEFSDILVTTLKKEFLQSLVDNKLSYNLTKSQAKSHYDRRRKKMLRGLGKLGDEFVPIFEIVDSFYSRVFHLQHIYGLKKDLGDKERGFPSFEQCVNCIEFQDTGRLLIADDMGLGKTGSAICAIESLGKQAKPCLIVTPAVMAKDRLLRLSVENGYFEQGHEPKVLFLDDPQKCNNNFADYDYVVMTSQRLNPNYVDKILQNNYSSTIIDEVHEMKNTSSGLRSRCLIQLADQLGHDGKLIALSGTPIPNKIKDIAILLRILYPNEFDNLTNQQLARSIVTQDKLHTTLKLRNKMTRKRLTDWVQMPVREDFCHTVIPTDLETNVAGGIMEDDTLTAVQKIMKLRKLYMCPSSLNPERKAPSAKMKFCADLVLQELQHKDKILIIFNDYIQEMIRSDSLTVEEGDILLQHEGEVVEYIKLHILENTSYEVNFSTYHGDTNISQRRKIQNNFNMSKGKEVLFLSGNSAKVGIDLSGAGSVIVYNQPRTHADMSQQIARAYRVGLSHKISIHRIYTQGTIEEGIMKYSDEKNRIITKIIDDTHILTEKERELLQKEEATESGYHVNSEFAQFYFGEKELLNMIFRINKEVGQQKFIENMSNLVGGISGYQKYADIYKLLGKRNYQYNANRVNSYIIKKLLSDYQTVGKVRILDIASGNQVLAKTIANNLQDHVTSIDINLEHFSQPLTKFSQDGGGKKELGEFFWGSLSRTLYDDQSFDVINCSLALHYTALNDRRGYTERIESLMEMNRNLKIGGFLIINEIYSLNFVDIQLFESAIELLGFKMIKKYSGTVETNNDHFSSHLYSLQKTHNSPKLQELLKNEHHRNILFKGLQLKKTDGFVSHPSMMFDNFVIGGKTYNLDHNTDDANLKNEQEKAFQLIDRFKIVYGDVMKIPESILHSNGFFSFYDTNKQRKKIRRIARKMSDGSYVFPQ